MPIKILPPEIVSKIAAGEVIERPASVIKELLENSLDAGATDIRIALKDAGKELIHIRDNGHGISPEDLENIFNRHATSKITSADDLYAIQSLGFRGEALYSIAAISDVLLKTNNKDNHSGEMTVPIMAWELHVRGGERLSLKPCALNGHGTDIAVRELFFNTPARRKFLKSNTTELNAVLDIIVPYALFYPERHFYLEHEGRVLIDTPPADSLSIRAGHLLKVDHTKLLDSRHTFADKNFTCRVILGTADLARSRRDMQYIFVNGRPVQSKSIAFHLNDVYRLLLPSGSYPVFLLLFDIPPENVDANVHPTKREVKIRDEQAICAALRHFCESLLMTKSGPKIIQTDTGRGIQSTERETRNTDTNLPNPIPYTAEPSADYALSHRLTNEHTVPQAVCQNQAEFFIQNAIYSDGKNLRAKLSDVCYIGPFHNKYLLFESGASLLIVDQHAAQERIMFEALITQMQKGKVEIQNLLVPVIVKLTTPELLVWEELQTELELFGFDMTQFDNESVAIHSAPALIKDIQKAVGNILHGEPIARHDHEALARRACRSSVMSGERLTPEQAMHQRDQLLRCLNPFTCPHGRPTVMELTEDFLNKQFLRV